ncbi:nitrate reductase molybdenum cofactor assembly chaperone [Listeria sp. PSOL-1]|uniref:nitrate reductase molybdenum cofactor assembly chaperone n=1 Tax=Listeria sp. PSOL-1 TaxID=1844999 RepID=UPI0013D489B5|nr:nitrate reductase molybdenum cofactor assembly chaperone [Listeria sp. PSOL-1]
MIDSQKLNDKRPVFGKLSSLLSYPEKQILNEEFIFKQLDLAEKEASECLASFWQEMKLLSFTEIEEKYVTTFDFSKATTMYMTFYKFEDARERGQMLAKLKVLYEMFGLLAEDTELTDYLPLMLEFYEAGEWYSDERIQDIEVSIGVIEDGTYHLLNALQEEDHPYQYLIQAVRTEFKACLLHKGGTAC